MRLSHIVNFAGALQETRNEPNDEDSMHYRYIPGVD